MQLATAITLGVVTYAVVDTLKEAVVGYGNTYLFISREKVKPAAIYAASMTCITKTITVAAGVLTGCCSGTILATAAFNMIKRLPHADDRSAGAAIGLLAGIPTIGVTVIGGVIGSIVSLPVAFTIGVVSGRFLANKFAKDSPQLTGREIVKLHIIRFLESAVIGL